MAANEQPEQEHLAQQPVLTQPSHGQDTTMRVEFSNKLGSRGVVKDWSGATIYAIEYHMRSPHVRFKDVSGSASQSTGQSNEATTDLKNTAPFGSATFHLFRTRIDLSFRNSPQVELKCTKWLKGHYNYASPAFNGQTLTWKSASGWKNIDYVCIDERSRAIGKFTSQSWWITGKGIGGLEFDEDLIRSNDFGVVDEQGARARREELLVIGSSVAYWVMVNTTAAIA